MGIETDRVAQIQRQSRCLRGVTADHPAPEDVSSDSTTEMLPEQGGVWLLFERQIVADVRMDKEVNFRLLLSFCRLNHQCLLPEEHQGKRRFRDILRDETVMHWLFEDFIRNFAARHLTGAKV